MRKTFWIGTGTRETELHNDPQNPNPRIQTEDVGVEVEADNLTIEPSGALTLWLRDGEARAALVMAFAPGHWTKCHLIAATMKPGD